MKRCQLSDLVTPVDTWNPARSGPEESFQYIDLSAVDQEMKSIVGAREVGCAEAPSRARQLVEAGDILVSTVRPNLNGVARVPEELDGATASTGFCVVRPKPELLDSSYLFHWVKSAEFINDMVKKATGASYPAVSDRIVLASMIPLPSLAVQRRIAAILDQADALRAKRREALALLDELQRGIFIEMFGHPAHNTKGLPLIALGEAGTWQSGGTPPRTQEHYFDGEIPWFSSGELESIYVRESIERITSNAIAETSAKLVKKGSLMLGMYDTAALKASISGVDCSCNQAIAFSPLEKGELDVVYAYYAIVIGREHFRRLQRGVRQKNLNLEMIRGIEIPFPPMEYQREFSRRTTQMNSLAISLARSLVQLDALFDCLQHRAFRGEL